MGHAIEARDSEAGDLLNGAQSGEARNITICFDVLIATLRGIYFFARTDCT
jgi:hypothetical protein